MEIKTEILNNYTKRVDKLLKRCNNKKYIIYGLVVFISLSIFGFVVSFFLK
jgi:hypothetical protein